MPFVLRGPGTLDLGVDVCFVPFKRLAGTAFPFAAGTFWEGDFEKDISGWSVVGEVWSA